VPYRNTDTNHALVRVRVNGKGPFNFLVDTGAPLLIISTDKGLAGALNTNLMREAARFDADKTMYVVSGRKARQLRERQWISRERHHRKQQLAGIEFRRNRRDERSRALARDSHRASSLPSSTAASSPTFATSRCCSPGA
jgi:hypothetical protein